MRRFGKLAGFFVVFIAVMAAFCTVSFAATVGQQLTSPESGWQRIDDIDSKIKYNGTWQTFTYSGFWGGTDKYSLVVGSTVKFNFYGTKLRVIGQYHRTASNNTQIIIDGINYNYSEYNSSINDMNGVRTIVYEKTGIEQKVHSVEITVTNTNTTRFDAIDIDETGYLVDINTPINLNAISGNKKVDLSWDSVEGATSYIVKRALTASGPYTTIATTSAITYPDSSVTNGTTYYYVVSAVVNGTESPNSNEASATPTAPEIIGNPGILEITMTNGQIKEYDLSGAELLAFLNWYDGKSDGTGKAYYTITKKNNIKPFLSRKEYIAFDKISSFEVKEYTE